MAAETKVSEDIVKRMTTAALEGDGITATRLLEEVGSCGWKDLVKQTNKRLDETSQRTLSSESSVKYTTHIYESLTLHLNTNTRSTPLASTTEVRCEKK